ncbi:hypothetical protein [Microbacterium sp. A94]|uniref:hypothetical protein n=1 Tax=Microbacterium sp. A94 TaxID=3450717 RepID=UPI003F42F3B8
MTSYKIVSEDGVTGFLSPFEGADDRPTYLEGTAYQSLAEGSLWRFARDHSGERVEFVVAPHGNAEPGINQPHYRGSVVVGPKPDLGGEAEDRTFLFEFAWRVVGEVEELA